MKIKQTINRLSRKLGLCPTPEEPKPPIVERDFWIDPDPHKHSGLLLSDRIAFYVKKVHLIWPFDPKSLRPASYTLHAGHKYILNNKEGNLEEEGTVQIPPNGLIYIQFLEEVNIPHYMIARFNLRVKQVYRGLLLGTGPQVDPGFRGHLFCPIHNFVNEPKTIHFRDPLATIDFVKTTELGENYFPGMKETELTSEAFERMRKGEIEVRGIDNLPCLIFSEKPNRPLQEYLPHGESVKSSIFDLYQKVKRSEKISIWTAIGITIALIGSILSVFQIVSKNLDGYRELKDNIGSLRESVGKLEGARDADKAKSPSTPVVQSNSEPPAPQSTKGNTAPKPQQKH